jgi:endo-1,4-beta-mannosidase
MTRWIGVLSVLLGVSAAGAGSEPPKQPGLFQIECGFDSWNMRAYKDKALYEKLRDLGCTLVRLPIYWSAYQEDGPDTFSPEFEAKVDYVIDTMREAGIEVIFDVCGTPWWASGQSKDKYNHWWESTDLLTADGKPNMDSCFARFVRHVVTRYRDRVRYWEIWNEESDKSFWKPEPSPGHYLAMLRIGYSIVKELDPDGLVLIGGLAGAIHDRPYKDSDFAAADPFIKYCSELYSLGAAKYYDIANVHAYSRVQLANSLDVVRRLGGSDKPIWLTEFGADSVALTEDGQLHRMTALATEAASEGVPVMCFFSLEWNGRGESGPRGYALLNKDRTPKKAYAGYRTLARELNGLSFEKAIDVGGKARAFVFSSGLQRKLVVVCDADEADARIPFDGITARVVSLGDGTESTESVTDGALKLKLTRDPVLITSR